MRVAFATCSARPDGFVDDHSAARLVGAEFCVWSDPAVDWSAFDRVVLRSVWDYTWRLPEFLAWCESVGPGRLRNSPATIAFNCDKRYLGELSVPTVPTIYVGPGDVPRLEGEVVVKPNVSAGARDTGRFPPAAHGDALELIASIHAGQRVALLQPYIASVGERGEVALVFIGGELSHVLRKRPILRDVGIPELADDDLRPAAVMYEDDLVAAAHASEEQHALAEAALDEVRERFGVPLYARVDLVDGEGGAPLVSELELIEPALYLATAAGASARLAAAITAS